jgi:NADH-ubiquinone oxidoreductase chain 2
VQAHALTETEEIQNSKEYYNNVSNQTKAREYSLIVLFNILGALLLITSSDLVSMYLSIELQSFGLYILASIYKDKRSSISAGLKYFLLGGLSSCIILLGSGLIYSYTGITKFDLIFVILNIYSKGSILDIQGISIGLILVFIGFMFKIAAAPFHNWSIDVYNDSPTLVTIWLTVMPKLSILIFLLQILVGVGVNLNFIYSIELNNLPYASVNILSNLLLLSSLLSLILGAIVGLSQVKIKRLLAYSTVNHVGFLLLSLSVFTSSISNFNQSIESFIFYIIQYTLTNLNIFLIILALSYIINKNINIKLNLINSGSNATKAINTYAQSYIRSININISDMEYINSLKGLFYNNPILSLSLSLCLFSFAGVPPLIGFFAKQQVLYSSNSAGYFFLSLIAIIVSVISAFYYLKIIKIVFSMPSTPNTNSNNEIKESSELEIELNNNIITSPASAASASQLVSRNQVLLLSNSHSLLIGTLTVFLITFILNPELIFNSMAIISSFNFKT